MNSTTERRRAIARGLNAIYEVAREPQTFSEHGGDLLWCFHLISSTSADSALIATAYEMGKERARVWHATYESLPPDADAETIVDYLWGCSAAQHLGVSCGRLMKEIRNAARRFSPADFLCFDPRNECVPEQIVERCVCNHMNEHTRKTCLRCKRKLKTLNRLEIGFYALTRSYELDCSRVRIGARYADVLKRLRALRPYRGFEGGENRYFYDTVYFVTHVVYTLNGYGAYRLSPRRFPDEFQFLKENVYAAIELDDPEMVGEFLDSLKAFGLPNKDPLIKRATSYLLSTQNGDGSWGEPRSRDRYLRYHPTWTAIDGLRDYAWKGGQSSFSKLNGDLGRARSGK